MSIISVSRPTWLQDKNIKQQMTIFPPEALFSPDMNKGAEPGQEPVPAVLHTGEEVVPKKVVDKVGGSKGLTKTLNAALEKRQADLRLQGDGGTVQPGPLMPQPQGIPAAGFARGTVGTCRSIKGYASGTTGTIVPEFGLNPAGPMTTTTGTQATTTHGHGRNTGVPGNTDVYTQPPPNNNPPPVLNPVNNNNNTTTNNNPPPITTTSIIGQVTNPLLPYNAPIPTNQQPGSILDQNVRNQVLEDLQKRMSIQEQVANMNMTQQGITGTQAETLQQQNQQAKESAVSTAAEQLGEAEQTRRETQQMTALSQSIDAGDFTTANQIQGQLGMNQTDFTRLKNKQDAGDLIGVANDLMDQAQMYAASGNTELATLYGNAAGKARYQAYSMVAGTQFDPAALDAVVTAANTNNTTDPALVAMQALVIPSVTDWFKTADGNLSLNMMKQSPYVVDLINKINGGDLTAVSDFSNVVSLMFGNALQGGLSDAQIQFLKDKGLYINYSEEQRQTEQHTYQNLGNTIDKAFNGTTTNE